MDVKSVNHAYRLSIQINAQAYGNELKNNNPLHWSIDCLRNLYQSFHQARMNGSVDPNSLTAWQTKLAFCQD